MSRGYGSQGSNGPISVDSFWHSKTTKVDHWTGDADPEVRWFVWCPPGIPHPIRPLHGIRFNTVVSHGCVEKSRKTVLRIHHGVSNILLFWFLNLNERISPYCQRMFTKNISHHYFGIFNLNLAEINFVCFLPMPIDSENSWQGGPTAECYTFSHSSWLIPQNGRLGVPLSAEVTRMTRLGCQYGATSAPYFFLSYLNLWLELHGGSETDLQFKHVSRCGFECCSWFPWRWVTGVGWNSSVAASLSTRTTSSLTWRPRTSQADGLSFSRTFGDTRCLI